MIPWWLIILLAGVFAVSALAAVVAGRNEPGRARIDHGARAVAGAAGVTMIVPGISPLIFASELVLFTAATTWFATRLGSVSGLPSVRLRVAGILRLMHSLAMAAAMAIMAYQCLGATEGGRSHPPQSGHHATMASGADLVPAALMVAAVFVGVSSLLHLGCSVVIPESRGRSRGWAAWSVGALESAATLVLIAAMVH